MAGLDPWASANQGIANYTNTLLGLSQMKRQDMNDNMAMEDRAERSKLSALQTQAAQQSIDQNKITLADLNAKQAAKIDQYGTAKHTNPLASAYSFENQKEQEAEQQKAQREKQKFAFEAFTKVEEAVKNRTIDPKKAGDFYHTQMKLAGLDLDGAGVKMEFMDRGSYFSGPITPDALFMVNGKPTPYGGAGTITKARIVGQDPQSGKPIFEMDEHTTFAEAKPDQEALIDKRFANQQKLQAEQIAAQDRRTAAQIAAADRRSDSRADGSSKPPSGYRWADDGTLQAIPGGPGDLHGKGGKVLPAGQLESIADMKRVKDVMAEARQAFDSKKVSTGPIAGRAQALGSMVGLASDDFVDVQQKLQTAENIMLKLRSGAAVTESEYQRFKKEFPRTSDAPAVMQRKMNNAIAYADTLMDSKMDIYEEGGYRIPQSVKSGGKPATTVKPAAKKSAGYSDLLNKYRK
jgi:hypothetical protein